ncbi:S41 family peptidase [Kamptonema cortianum]|nr:S41 family peptidase [Geitlerinema splendidum]MDK3161003.1 S41 family peptidase [Kamptonema cortianum]
MLRTPLIVAMVIACSSAMAIGPNQIKRTLDPALSPDGSTLAFIWQGDLFTVPAQGGEARRLTINSANESFPIWTKDGKSIVFASNRFGSNDLFVMDADGTDLRRINFESSNEYPTAVSADGMIYGYTNAWGRLDLFRVSINGGDLVRITGGPLEMEYYADVSPDGKSVIYNTAGSAGHWRKPGHRGANTGEIWKAQATAPLSGLKQITKNDALDMFPTYLSANEIVFMSNRDGAQNVWMMDADGGRVTKLTSFADGTIRSLSASGKTRTVTFQRNSEIYALNVDKKSAAAVTITAPADSRRIAEQEFALTTGANDFVVSPNGKLMAIAVRGDIFVLPSGGGTTRQLTKSVRMDSNPTWLDDDTILYTAAGDKSHRSLRTVTILGQDKPFYSEKLDVMSPMVSPDRKWVAFHRSNSDICVMPASGGTPTLVAKGDFSRAHYGARSFNWTSDSEWLAIDSSATRSVELRLVSKDGSKKILVTRVGKGAGTPIVTANGKHFVYAGTQGLDFDETRQSKSPLYIVDLVPQEVTYSEDDLDNINVTQEKKQESNQVVVDERGLNLRVRKLSGSSNGYWAGPSGSTFYANIDGQLSIVDASNGSARPAPGLTGPASDMVFVGGKTYVRQGSTISILQPTGTLSPVRYRAESRVDMVAEEVALFEEAWWALDRLFYDPNMHGKSWDGIRQEFAKLVPFATSRSDFYDLMDEMVERLDSSHQGANSSENIRPEVNEVTGWLGIEWDWAQLANGRYVVGRVFDGLPAAHPESELKVGDVIVAVNGVRPTSRTPYAELMRGQSGRKVRLTVERGGKSIDLTIKPIPKMATSSVAYAQWVRDNKERVDKLSNGRLGYIHIQGMNESSLDTFLTEIATDLEGKEGLVVDVRYNGGGYTSHIILNIMRKVPWMIRTNRDQPGIKFSENQYRGNALELPAACLTNEYSFSNAEIFSEGFRRLKLGPVVGEATGGGVIGTSSFGFWDGGSIRMPASGAYTVDGENLEQIGRKPDIDIQWDPVQYELGRDIQLERAVSELMKKLGPG